MVNNLHGWLRHYFENKFYENDPHVVHPDNIVAGLTLWGSVTDDELQYKSTMLLAAHELFDFHCGASLIRKHTEYYEIFMFNHYQGNKYKVYAKYMNQQFCLEHFADYFLKQGAGILKKLPAIDIAALKSRFNTQKGILAEIIPEPSWI
ncbi:MAG: hypothetical protein COC15_00550 [Legionellales bacterium]|nr:MAG: hypothetical protein COC15_00550 [Legionellales bacterium]